LRKVAIRIGGFWCRFGGRSRGSGDGFGLGSGDVVVFDDYAFRRVVPFTFVVDQGAGADGLEDLAGGGGDGFGLFGDVDGGVADVTHAFVDKAGGVGVAVDGSPVEVIFGGDIFGAVPVEEVGVDVGAVFVAADGAFAGVAGEGGGLAARKRASAAAVGGGAGGGAVLRWSGNFDLEIGDGG